MVIEWKSARRLGGSESSKGLSQAWIKQINSYTWICCKAKDHKCCILPKLHRLPDHDHHALHPGPPARESLPLLHPIGMVGAVLAMVLHHRPASDKRRDRNSIREESSARNQSLADRTLSNLHSKHYLNTN